MSDDNAPPSIEPGNEDSLVGAFETILEKFLQNVDDCLPCTVIAVRGRTHVTVQPVVMMATTDGQKISRAQVPEVPILNMGAGGFVMSFPVKAGDFGWLKATDRDISLFLQGLTEDAPNTRRKHSFQDGFFIPDVMRTWTINGADTERFVVQTADGTTRVAIGPGLVEITAPTKVRFVTPLAEFTGDVTAAGTITGQTDVIGGGKSVKNHTHTSASPGSPTSPPL